MQLTLTNVGLKPTVSCYQAYGAVKCNGEFVTLRIWACMVSIMFEVYNSACMVKGSIPLQSGIWGSSSVGRAPG